MTGQEAAIIGALCGALAVILGKLIDLWVAHRKLTRDSLSEAISREATVQVQAWKELADYRHELRAELDDLRTREETCTASTLILQGEVRDLKAAVALAKAAEVACHQRLSTLEATVQSLKQTHYGGDR